MAHDFAQRRRVAVGGGGHGRSPFRRHSCSTAAAATAEPATTGHGRHAVGTVPRAGGSVGRRRRPGTGVVADGTDALGTASAGYLSGTTVPGDVGGAQIAVPRLPESVRTGMATLQARRSTRPSALPRSAPTCRSTPRSRCTNLDNGRSVHVRQSIARRVAAGTTIVLDHRQFAQIADLADAPVPVAASRWNERMTLLAPRHQRAARPSTAWRRAASPRPELRRRPEHRAPHRPPGRRRPW